MPLIDSDAFRKEMQEYVLPITKNNLMGAADAYYRILHLLESAPTIEAEPIKHGQWRDNKFCTNCGGFAEDEQGNIIMSFTDYCPFCGAKMDGGNNNASN